MLEQTPLETLTEMNERVGRTRKRPARPVDSSKRVERFYRQQLRSLVRAIYKDVREELVPIIKEEQSDYTLDSAYTKDSWSDRIIEALNSLIARYAGPASIFEKQYDRLAARTVSMAEAETTQAFLDSVNKAVGVDLAPVLDSEGMRDYINIATRNNVDLIKSVPREYFDRIENAVLGGIRDGRSPSYITKQIREATGVTDRQARRIARDQSSRLSSDIARRRQEQAGIKYFRWVTSGDERVTGKPGGKYPNASIKCYEIARRDIGFGKGVYPISKGASWRGESRLFPGNAHVQCRCTQTPIFDFELPKDKR